MRFLKWALVLIAACLSTGAFCAPPTDSSERFLVGADDGQVFVEYYPEYDGWESWPSSLWSVDAASGEARRIYDVRTLYFVQPEGDYYVAEEPLEDGKKGRIFGVQISTGRRTNIETHDTPDGAGYDSGEFLLSQGRVLLRTADGLLLYDLVADQAVRTIPVRWADAALTAFEGDRAVVSVGSDCTGECDPARFMLIDLEDGAVVEIPGPMSGSGYYFGTVLTDRWLMARHTAFPDESTGVDRLLACSIAEQTWRTVVEFEPYNLAGTTGHGVFLVDGNDQFALLEELSGPLGLVVRIVLVDIESGQSTTVLQTSTLLEPSTGAARLVGNTVRWLTANPQAVRIYDIATGQTSTIPFQVPR